MTFEEFKADFDSTIGAMTPDELLSALERAGVKTRRQEDQSLGKFVEASLDVLYPPTCKCGDACQWYGVVGGFSKQCLPCNQRQGVKRRAASLRLREKRAAE